MVQILGSFHEPQNPRKGGPLQRSPGFGGTGLYGERCTLQRWHVENLVKVCDIIDANHTAKSELSKLEVLLSL
jgi:hypothetical protein